MTPVVARGRLLVESVVKMFGGMRAVDGVDLEISAGEFVVFLGPSGCGKTTLLRMIAGFETPDAGEISLDGRGLAKVPPSRRDIGMVFQNLALFPHLNVEDNVGFGLSLRGLPAAQIRSEVGEALSRVALDGFGSRAVQQLSGGQRQRVALARALVLRPAVLLLDEPLSALDLKLRRQLQTELKELQRGAGTTFVFVTHDQEEALSMADRVAVFDHGRLEQFGNPHDLYRRPVSRFVAEFVGESNIRSPAELDGLGISVPVGHLLVFRPEDCMVGPAAETTPVRFDATVSAIDFVGPYARVALDVDGRSGRWVALCSGDVAGRLSRGSTTRVGIAPDAAARVKDAAS